LLTALADREQINTTTDSSKINPSKALAVWLDDDECDDDDEDLVTRQRCLLCGTILVDGWLADNTSFRSEALGKLIITII